MKHIAFLSLCVALTASQSCYAEPNAAKPEPAPAKIETYNYAKSLEGSQAYSVNVNDIPQFVLSTEEPDICIFGCDGPVTVAVSSRSAIKNFRCAPVNKHYPAVLKDNTIYITLSPYDKAVLEINDNPTKPLFIFANPLEKRPDPKTPGLKYFKAGKVYGGKELSLSSASSIYIEGGAVISGSIKAHAVANISVSGCGILDASLYDESKAVLLENCRCISIKDITVLNKTNWTTLLAACSDIEMDNYKVVATFSNKKDNSGNENDACDLLGCAHARITNGFSYCHDDAFCVKSRKWNYQGEACDIHFENCIGWNVRSGNTFEIGYELNCDVHDISFKDIYAIRTAGGAAEYRRGAIGIQNGAGGTVSNVSYENVYIEDSNEYGIYMTIIKSNYNIGNGVEWTPGAIKDIHFKNVHIDRIPPYKNFIGGLDDTHKIENVTFDGLYVEGKKVLNCDEALIKAKNTNNIMFK